MNISMSDFPESQVFLENDPTNIAFAGMFSFLQVSFKKSSMLLAVLLTESISSSFGLISFKINS